jgi:hypothetical protein
MNIQTNIKLEPDVETRAGKTNSILVLFSKSGLEHNLIYFSISTKCPTRGSHASNK